MPSLEMVDVVDENDNVIETRALNDCLKFGLLHRAITVFLRNSKGDVFLQQRSKTDDWLPSLWTASCTGHVKTGEDAHDAAERELKEEIGISCHPEFLFKFITPTIKFMDKIERELDIVFEATSDQPIRLDKKEVERGAFLTIEECKDFFKVRKDEITLDARLAFEKYLA